MKPTALNCPQGESCAGFPGCDDLIHEYADLAIIGLPRVSTYPNQTSAAFSAEQGADQTA